MFKHMLNGTFHAHALLQQGSHALGDFLPHLSTQPTLSQSVLFMAVIGACVACRFLFGLELTANATVGAFKIYMVVRVAMVDGEHDCRHAGVWNALFNHGVKGGVEEFQELLVTLAAQIAPLNVVFHVFHGDSD